MEAWETCYCLHFFFISKVINPVNEALCLKQNQYWPLLIPKSSLHWWAQVNINICNKKYNKIILSMFDGAHVWFIHWYLTYSTTRMSFLPVFDGHSESGHVCTRLVIKMVMYIKFTSAEYQDIHFVTHFLWQN